ncbi:MAG TPA: hypothetical protein VMV53_00840 [Acidimicrobiales bacterium]|nr:hypothetical protein [Acidimicrobiales bacterium]
MQTRGTDDERSSYALAHSVRSPGELEPVIAEAGRGRVTRGGTPTAWGAYSDLRHDPDEHPREVVRNSDWPLGPDGAVTLGDQ